MAKTSMQKRIDELKKDKAVMAAIEEYMMQDDAKYAAYEFEQMMDDPDYIDSATLAMLESEEQENGERDENADCE